MTKKYLSVLLCLCFAFIPVIAFATTDTDVITEDFESYDVGVIASSAGTTAWNDFSFSLGEGDKAEIISDNGNKVLKVTKGSGTGTFSIHYSFDKITSGITDVSFDFRATHHSKWFGHLGSLVNEAGGNVGRISSYTSSLYVTNNTNSKNVIQYSTLSNSEKYAHIIHTMDFINAQHIYKTSYVNSSGSTSNKTRTDASAATNITQLWWSIRNEGNASGWKGNAAATTDNPNNNGIYYIDNIEIRKYNLKVKSVSLPKTDVSLEPSGEITFNTDILGSSFNDTSVLLNGEKLNASLNGNKITFSPLSALDYETEYTLTVSKAIGATGYAPMSEDYTYTFKTESAIPVYTDLTDGGRYTEGFIPLLPEKTGVSYTYEVDGTPYTKGTAFTQLGNVSLKITAVNDSNGKSQTKTIGFEIIGAVAPEAKDVKIIDGTPRVGSTLTGDYEYTDLNGDAQGTSTFKWYRCSEENGTYTEIKDANALTYVITSDDEDCYLKFGVTPVAVNAPTTGTEVLSDPFMSEFNPTATEVKISGTVATNSELSGTFLHHDLNGDILGVSVYAWYRCSTENGTYTKIDNSNSDKYKLTSADEDNYIKFGVTPKNNGTGKQDKEFLSPAIKGAFKPVVTDVTVTGTLKSGNSVGASYMFYDENGDQKGSCIVEWYVGGAYKKTGESYTIADSDSGKSLYIKVTPVAVTEPYNGLPVASETYSIASAGNGNSYTGAIGGGGGGGGGSFKPSKPETSTETETTKEPETSVTPEVNETIVFSDMENHWANKTVLNMYKKGIVNGKSENTFDPDGNITRAEFAAIIARLYKLEAGENKFSDVENDSWYCDYVTAMEKAGIMSGFEDKFRPNDNITREEICVVINNILKTKAQNEGADFGDNSEISDWAKEAVNTVSSLGIVKGDNGNFRPKSPATRAEATVITERMLETEEK